MILESSARIDQKKMMKNRKLSNKITLEETVEHLEKILLVVPARVVPENVVKGATMLLTNRRVTYQNTVLQTSNLS